MSKSKIQFSHNINKARRQREEGESVSKIKIVFKTIGEAYKEKLEI
tara:strand:+ start:2214 stop:2351 length:138 start_codon:yes stop_codon:yes gene_type:complete